MVVITARIHDVLLYASEWALSNFQNSIRRNCVSKVARARTTKFSEGALNSTRGVTVPGSEHGDRVVEERHAVSVPGRFVGVGLNIGEGSCTSRCARVLRDFVWEIAQ